MKVKVLLEVWVVLEFDFFTFKRKIIYVICRVYVEFREERKFFRLFEIS